MLALKAAVGAGPQPQKEGLGMWPRGMGPLEPPREDNGS